MNEPRLRTVNKAKAPYELNCFPKSFIEKFTEEIVYLHATKTPVSLEGEEWEQIFARCIHAEWKPSNVGLDDVQLENCCWSAKTVKSSRRDLSTQADVRLISGRNSPVYSYGESIGTDSDPNEIGKMVLEIWNERVSAIRQVFKFARTVVLVKGGEHDDFLIFETDTIRYDPELYHFAWNSRGNLEGYENSTQKHRFTWQPHGSQFTIIEDIPEERLHLKITIPQKVERKKILEAVGYTYSSYWVVELP